MSRENVETVQRMLEKWNAADIERWLQSWHGDAEWVSEPFAALDGSVRTYLGHAGLRRFAADVLEGFADLGRIDRPEFRDAGHSVLVLGDYVIKAKAGGPELSTPMAWLFEVRDGKIARGRDFRDQDAARTQM